jgi:uncharacterized protein
MLLNLRKIRGTEEHVERTFQPSDFSQQEETYRVIAAAELSFDIRKQNDHFALTGTVKTTLELPCSRCLEDFTHPVEAEFDLRYLPEGANAGEDEREIDEDDLTTAFYRDDTIDLGQLMREQFYLALPMKPLCKEECRGLCPECGMNLNAGLCTCTRRWSDSRLDPLKSMVDRRPS